MLFVFLLTVSIVAVVVLTAYYFDLKTIKRSTKKIITKAKFHNCYNALLSLRLFKCKKMNIQEEKNLLNLRNQLLSEIDFRNTVLEELKSNHKDEKGFVSGFIRNFLKIKTHVPNLFFKNDETYGRYLIDADKELIKDIKKAFEKSIDKMKIDYENATLKDE